MKFRELVGLLEQNGFKLLKEKGSIQYYGKPGWDKLVRNKEEKGARVRILINN